MSKSSVTDARARLPELIAQASSEAVFLERRGKVAAVLVSPEQYARMHEALEDAEDVAAFDVAMGRGRQHSLGAGQSGSRLDVSKYRIELRPAAVKALRRIDPQDRGRVQGAIALLGEDPRPPGARALQGRDGYRVRVGNYRIIYTIRNDILVVVVVTVGHRRDVYE